MVALYSQTENPHDGAMSNSTRATHTEQPQCVVRLGEPCRLCQPGATGPDDCQLAYLVLTDDDLRAELARRRHEMDRAAQGGTLR